MPLYSFTCSRDAFTFDVGMSVALFRAKRDEAKENAGIWAHLKCPRCTRHGTCFHDMVGDARTQATHDGTYTFYGNAPDEILQGQRERTVSTSEAKSLMKEHGLADAGKSGKHATPTSMLKDGSSKEATRARWEREAEEKEERDRIERARIFRERVDAVAAKASQSTEDCKKPVDTEAHTPVTLAESWHGLRKQARSLGVKFTPKTRRPKLEELTWEKLQERELFSEQR